MTQSTIQATLKKDAGTQNQVGQPKPNRCVAFYDFASEGGAVSQITLRGDTVPLGAMCRLVDIVIDTVPTSGGAATISLDLESAADLQAAVAYNGAPYSTTGIKSAIKNPTTTADRAVKATIAGAALTAGKFRVVVEYWMPAA